ncbi:LacI family DNA-binding transcriptional regulator [Nesterenkonia halotolerans]|uniref:LacI family DNA-binding transcriptional regulator n=1 Tax=Nesterenkonia halotolerans TaxID=225325 RepID=UPI00298F216D|nr:LacI family DNA-binding transcriptional regulator [Nesterenkonia halotolerans]
MARLAGVSHQTVSRYLRDHNQLKPANRARVRDAVEQLNYRPNTIARSMRTRRSGVLAVVLPAQPTALPTPTLAGAADAAHAAGYAVETAVVDGNSEDRAVRVMELLNSGRVEGVLSLAALPAGIPAMRPSSAAALMVIEEFDDDLRNIGPLTDASVMAEIVETLARWGHTNFLHIQGPQDWSSARARKHVFNETIQRLGLTAETSKEAGWDPEVGYRTIHGLSGSSAVTAVIAANDFVAVGAIRALHERGWQVPKEISVVGWDDLRIAQYGTPSLSTVSVDHRGQGSYAMNRLVALLEKHDGVSGAPMANRLVLRETTGPAPLQEA